MQKKEFYFKAFLFDTQREIFFPSENPIACLPLN